MDYGIEHDGKVFTPNGSAVESDSNRARNTAIESAELAIWRMRPGYALAYYDFPSQVIAGPYRASFSPDLTGAVVTTWLGTSLGVITRARVYRHVFGGRFVAITVKGNNGAVYHGRASYDNGNAIRLYRSK